MINLIIKMFNHKQKMNFCSYSFNNCMPYMFICQSADLFMVVLQITLLVEVPHLNILYKE